jgi:arylsulfatase A-like enzyme
MGHNEPPYDASNPILKAGQPVAESEYLTDAFTREAVDFIQRRKDQPFFLYLAYNAVHSPLQGADKYMAQFAHIEDIHRRIFAAMLANLDDSVGEVLDAVRRAGLENNTLIFFLSDNGGPTRELTSSNHPLRGGKGQMYEGGLRIPFMVQWKGQLPAGKVYPGFVVSVDIFATAANLGGATTRHIDGVNLMPFLTGKNPDPPRDTFYWRQGNKTAFRKGPWKLVSMRHKQAKPVWELYNIANDISETTNLAAQQPDRLNRLVTLWQTMDDTMKEPLF